MHDAAKAVALGAFGGCQQASIFRERHIALGDNNQGWGVEDGSCIACAGCLARAAQQHQAARAAARQPVGGEHAQATQASSDGIGAAAVNWRHRLLTGRAAAVRARCCIHQQRAVQGAAPGSHSVQVSLQAGCQRCC